MPWVAQLYASGVAWLPRQERQCRAPCCVAVSSAPVQRFSARWIHGSGGERLSLHSGRFRCRPGGALHSAAEHGIYQIDLALLVELEDVHIRKRLHEVDEDGGFAQFQIGYREAPVRVGGDE